MLFPYRDSKTGKFARAVVRNLPESNAIEFINDSFEVTLLRAHFGKEKCTEFDSFFVVVDKGDYIAAWGMRGIVPYLTKPLYRLL